MLDVSFTASAIYVNSASFRAMQYFRNRPFSPFSCPITATSNDRHDVWNSPPTPPPPTLPPLLASQIGKWYWFSKTIKLWQPIRLRTSVILVNQWPSEKIICLLLDGKNEIYFTFLVFRSYAIFDDTSLQLLANNLTISALHPHSFHLYSGYQR